MATVASATLAALGAISAASATEFNAGVVMEKMPAEARAWYIQGVIEGLAYARYESDNQHREGNAKTADGMKCVYDWFYEMPNTLNLIYLAFGKFPDYTPAAIIGSLIRQSCPE